ncbi:MAG: citrate transporter [Chloroflexi bacterium]|nr:MAG: citrate transporter [Chloroflexota bacterium]
METAIGVILLITYAVFIFYAVKGGNLLLGLFVMAVLWSGLSYIGGAATWADINTNIFQGGPEAFGPTAVNIIFGSWFGRILVETGIARTIIRKAVELGGDKPALTIILLCMVVGAIFTTAYGVGAVVAIGVIVFPIMLSLGIPKPLATGAFAMSVTNGLYFNNALLSQAAGTMAIGEEKYVIGPEWYSFAAVATAIHLAAIIVMVIVSTRKFNKVHAWASADIALGVDAQARDVNMLALITPILPVSLAIAFKFSSILAIVIAVIWALAWTGYLKGWNKIADVVQKTFYDGVADVGLVLGFLLFLQMFIRSAGAAKAFLAPIVAPILPTSLLPLFLVFGALGILALFRGPLTIWGAGAATFAIIAGTGLYPLAILYPLFYIPCSTITTNVCPTQSWNLWAIGYTKIPVKDFMKQTLVYALPLVFVLEVVAYFMFAA